MKQYNFLFESVSKRQNEDYFFNHFKNAFHVTPSVSYEKYISKNGLDPNKTITAYDLIKKHPKEDPNTYLKDCSLFKAVSLSLSNYPRIHIGLLKDNYLYHKNIKDVYCYIIKIDIKKLNKNYFYSDVDYYRYHLKRNLTKDGIPNDEEAYNDAFNCARFFKTIDYRNVIKPNCFKDIIKITINDVESPNKLKLKDYNLIKDFMKD